MTLRTLALPFASVLVLAACDSPATDGGTTQGTTASSTTTTAGAGGATTGAGGATSAGGSGSGGSGGATTSTGAGGACQGDEATWKKLTGGPFACTKNSDCCVIINSCINAAQIVAAKDVAAAKAAWPTCDVGCNDCIPPAVEVGCNAGECAGKVVDLADASAETLQDHCGVDPTVLTAASKLLFSCGAK